MNLFETLVTWDKELLLFLNGLHSNWMDHFMWLMSETMIWLPFYLLFIYLLIRNKQTQSLWIIITFALLITFADQIASGVFKPLVERLRPTHDPELKGLVHIVNHYKGGHYGFFSSHAANVFAFAGLSLLIIRNWMYTVTILIWASLISYSRIYLGVHFPLDILTGAIFGLVASYGFYRLYNYLFKVKPSRSTGKGIRRRKVTESFPMNQVVQLISALFIILIICLIASKYLSW